THCRWEEGYPPPPPLPLLAAFWTSSWQRRETSFLASQYFTGLLNKETVKWGARSFFFHNKVGQGLTLTPKSYDGYTPLHMAAIHSHESVLSVLVRDYGANCNIRDNSGKKPYHTYTRTPHPRLSAQENLRNFRNAANPVTTQWKFATTTEWLFAEDTGRKWTSEISAKSFGSEK
ncbi:hypothetical protein P4O66_019097, partial [Electrophorus voltai]